MKVKTLMVVVVVVLSVTCLTAHAATLKMGPAPVVEVENVTAYPLKAGLFFSAEMKEQIFVVKTSPFDKIKYPIGQYSVELFTTNMPTVFGSVVSLGARSPAEGVDLVIEVSIVNFDANIPHPAYNPYVASVIYRIDVYDALDEKVFTQTTTGSGQTSKGMMSGFKAKQLCAESAKLAMVDAMRQVLEGLMAAEEVGDLVSTPPES